MGTHAGIEEDRGEGTEGTPGPLVFGKRKIQHRTTLREIILSICNNESVCLSGHFGSEKTTFERMCKGYTI